ncbi:DivIVA domain-containing protein [Kribbella sp.]|uniref:DivIVA domain-containing protein n=1 Tax=Kribbella sp. TaxID=1871183 RepID=UPI002D6905E8|nr:DivIVA domain-containing protein [Kribbella sp.]HZX02496.1 DivIVA domain-containing protein [Kribbella sp.]
MTRQDPFGRKPAQSPYSIRNQLFSIRRKGYDTTEVSAYLADLSEQVEYADADRAELRAEVERLRQSTTDTEQRAHITAHAVGLLSQAQQIADNLVAEAEQYAKDLVENARSQQREALKQAHDSVESAVKHIPVADAPVAELEYVRTFTRVAHVQLRSVLDALAEQVERLGKLPDTPVQQEQQAPAGEVLWWNDLSAAADDAILDTRSPVGGHRRTS